MMTMGSCLHPQMMQVNTIIGSTMRMRKKMQMAYMMETKKIIVISGLWERRGTKIILSALMEVLSTIILKTLSKILRKSLTTSINSIELLLRWKSWRWRGETSTATLWRRRASTSWALSNFTIPRSIPKTSISKPKRSQSSHRRTRIKNRFPRLKRR